MNILDAILEAPLEQGRYFLVVKADDGKIGTVPLALDGSETQAAATRRFEDACAVSRMAMANYGGWNPCNYHVDGKPRTEFELACNDYLKKIREIAADNLGPGKIAIESLPEYKRMVTLRPPKDDPYWKAKQENSHG